MYFKKSAKLLVIAIILLTIISCTKKVEFTVIFNSNGGSSVNPIVLNESSNIQMPDDPVKEGYTFIGWYDNAQFSGEAITKITLSSKGSITLYAKWMINHYPMTFYIVTNVDDILLDIQLYTDEEISQASLGFNHFSAITSSGRIFTWGLNDLGQLGDGTTTYKYTPVEITANFQLSAEETITQISLGYSHSSAISSIGRIFTWGNNYNGQLGDGTIIHRLTPVEITANFNLSAEETITQVSLGHFHSSAITSTGRIFTWGSNSSGQLGDGTTTNMSTPVEINSHFNLSAEETITQVSLGSSHSSAITSTGRIFTWGFNTEGELGDGTTTNKSTPVEITSKFLLASEETITLVSLGLFHSSALTTTGRIFIWGRNSEGQLGDGTTINKFTPIEITSNFNLIEGERIVQVSLGRFHSTALTSTGRNFTWGRNSEGVAGDDTTPIRTTPIELGLQYLEIDSIRYYYYQDIFDNYLPVKEGYTFDGWYLDIELTIPLIINTMPSSRLILFGKWVLNA